MALRWSWICMSRLKARFSSQVCVQDSSGVRKQGLHSIYRICIYIIIYKIPTTLDSLPHAVLNCFLWSAFPVLAGGGGDYDPAQDTAVPPSLQENLKTLKRMGYPDTEQADKRSQLLPKVVTSLTKRLGKLDELKTEMGSAETNSTIFLKSLVCIHYL